MTQPERAGKVSPRLQATAQQRRLLTLAVVALFAATATQRAILVTLAVPPVWLLLRPYLLGRVGATHASHIAARSEVSPDRCLEGELVEISVRFDSDVELDQVDLTLVLGEAAELASGSPQISFTPAGKSVEASWTARARRWGRREIGEVEFRAFSGGRLLTTSGVAVLAEVSVFPSSAALSLLRTPFWLPDRVGDHVSRATGEGVEFMEVRDYRPGDRPRRINWRATARRATLQANKTAAERACDVVVLLDAFSDVGGVEKSSLDVAVRGAVAAAQAYLARHDRVGLVVLGSELVWLRPDVGGRQFYRVVEQVLDARRAHAADRPVLAGVPPAALPPGALAVMFSPLLDPRALEALNELRSRGVTPVVIDVRTVEPAVEPHVVNADLAVRLWRVEHALTLEAIRRSGVPIVGWDGRDGLDVAFSQLPNRMRSA